MGILDRFTSIVKANINELLDKAEDPEKMVDQYLREMTESLAEVREATAGVMAEEKRCKKLLDENREDTEKHEELARMALAADEAEPLIGHGVGGVCPFALNEGVDVFLDESLRRFDTVYPAAGNAASAVRLTPDELERCAAPCTWVDVCKVV